MITTDSTGKTVATGYGAGTTPSAIAEDPSARFVYITDEATNQLYGNLVANNGTLVPMVNGPFATGIFPVGLTIDPRGKFLYVANFSSNSVGAYAIDQSSGTPVGSVGSASTTVDTAPTCVTVEPALGIYLYSSNNLASTVSAMKLDPHNGGLSQVQNTPFPSSRTADVCGVSGEWIAPDAGHRQLAVNVSWLYREPRDCGASCCAECEMFSSFVRWEPGPELAT